MNDQPQPTPAHEPLPAEDLYRRTDPASLGFATTADVEPLDGIAGQPRAVSALELGVGMRHQGYNVFVLGPRGSGRHHAVHHFLGLQAAERPAPRDWCYVHNFEEGHKPCLLSLDAGHGRRLATDMEELVREIASALAGAFESDEYQSRRGALEEALRQVQSQAFDEVREKAEARGLVALRTPGGIAFAPRKDGEVMERDAFMALPEEERKVVEERIQSMQQEVQRVLRNMPARVREHRAEVRELNREMTRFAVGPLFAELAERYAAEADVVAYLEAAEKDVVEHAREILGHGQGQGQGGGEEEDGDQALAQAGLGGGGGRSLRRYAVNVVVDHSENGNAHAATGAAPIVHEDHPTYANLLGRVEYLPQMGALTTDFTLIKAGALQRANGGYLVLEAEKLLRQPFAWDGLKRALAAGHARIESPGQSMGLLSTVTLEPEPMPLDVKVVLIGGRTLYYLLASLDPELGELFKITADFDERMVRDGDHEHLYARLIAALARASDLLPFAAGGVARIIEHCARSIGDAERLSTRTSMVEDLMKEADHYARGDRAEAVAAAHVQRAIDAQVYRVSRAEDRLREAVLRRTLRVETEGVQVGQINGLAVLALGGYGFGRPSRISARVRMGKGEVVDIERQVKLSGPLHSKGVMILSSFLASRYAEEEPLSLEASLVFEQSYGGIDGDSASTAELVCLLSAIAEVPIRQSVAITGSVDQHGRVQAIGGVNEKIEGFFKLCAERGLTGEQGVVIPASNAKHLMLADEVVAAAREGRFHVWTVETVDGAAEVLTGLAAGERGADGRFPEGSLNRRVADRLAELAEKRRKLNARPKPGEGGNDKGGGGPAGGGEGDGDGNGDDDDDGGPDRPPGPPAPPPPVPPAKDGGEGSGGRRGERGEDRRDGRQREER
jgi:predicted ATP-dependent protease